MGRREGRKGEDRMEGKDKENKLNLSNRKKKVRLFYVYGILAHIKNPISSDISSV